MYFYEKRYYRPDGEVYVKRYSRSFPLREEKELSEDSSRLPGSGSLNPDGVISASISRARSRVRILAFSNPDLTGFLTLTQRDCPSEEESNRRFKVWIRKVSRHHEGFKYLGVKEYQKRGSIHWHLLVNFCPDGVLSRKQGHLNCASWSYGFSDYSPLEGDDNFRLELYLLKYLTKGVERLFKSYYVRSRNLNEIIPHYLATQESIHPMAVNIFYRCISNKYVDNFEVFEYNYNVTKKYQRR